MPQHDCTSGDAFLKSSNSSLCSSAALCVQCASSRRRHSQTFCVPRVRMACLCRSDTLAGSSNGCLAFFACLMNSSGDHGSPTFTHRWLHPWRDGAKRSLFKECAPRSSARPKKALQSAKHHGMEGGPGAQNSPQKCEPERGGESGSNPQFEPETPPLLGSHFPWFSTVRQRRTSGHETGGGDVISSVGERWTLSLTHHSSYPSGGAASTRGNSQHQGGCILGHHPPCP